MSDHLYPSTMFEEGYERGYALYLIGEDNPVNTFSLDSDYDSGLQAGVDQARNEQYPDYRSSEEEEMAGGLVQHPDLER
jgi:hypothetical protein